MISLVFISVIGLKSNRVAQTATSTCVITETINLKRAENDEHKRSFGLNSDYSSQLNEKKGS